MAAARSFWSKTALPTTNQSMPASRACLMVSEWMPPSISRRWSGLRSFFDGDGFGQHFGHELLAGETGVDAHDEDDVDMLDRGEDRVDRRRGAERDADAARRGRGIALAAAIGSLTVST